MSKTISSGHPCHVRVTSDRPAAVTAHDVVAWTVDDEFTGPVAWFVFQGKLVPFPDVDDLYYPYDAELVSGPAPEKRR